ncbi:unnamed protein product [Prunus armeniaca]
MVGVGRVALVKGYATDGSPFGVRMRELCPIMTPRAQVVIKVGIRLLKDNLCLRGKGIPKDTRHLTILDGLGLGSALSKMEGRYSDAGTHGLRPHAMHRWLCGTFGIHMSPRLGRHASMTTCVYSLRMWAIMDAKGMTNRSVVDVSYATLDVWASRVRCRMQSDCIVTCGRRLTGIRWDPRPHGCALSGEICVLLPPRRAARSSRDKCEALIPGQVGLELIDSDGGFCVRDLYLEEIGDGETLIARVKVSKKIASKFLEDIKQDDSKMWDDGWFCCSVA